MYYNGVAKGGKPGEIINIWYNFFFFFCLLSMKIPIDRPVSPLKPRSFHQIFVIYIIQQYVWDRFDKIYNFFAVAVGVTVHNNIKMHLSSLHSKFTMAFHPAFFTLSTLTYKTLRIQNSTWYMVAPLKMYWGLQHHTCVI